MGETASPDSGPRRRPLFLDPRLLTIFSISLIVVMGVSSIMPAFPAITRAFAITAGEVGWLVAVFTLPGIFLAPVWGVAADRWGRKRVLVPTLVLFALAGSAGALADDFATLLVLRALQGVGAAAIGALIMTLIGDSFSGQERVTAMGYNVGVLSTAAAAYPLIGGALALFGWRYPFALPLIALPVALLAMAFLHSPRPKRTDSLPDYLRKLAATAGQARTATLFVCSFMLFVQLYGPIVTYLPFLMEKNFATDSLDLGIIMMGYSLSGALASVCLGGLARRFSNRHILFFSFVILSLPLAALPFVSQLWLAVLVLALAGAGRGLGEAVVFVLLVEFTPAEQRASAFALNSVMFRLGQTIGPLLMAGLLALGGIEAVYIGSAVLTALPLVLIWRLENEAG